VSLKSAFTKTNSQKRFAKLTRPWTVVINYRISTLAADRKKVCKELDKTKKSK